MSFVRNLEERNERQLLTCLVFQVYRHNDLAHLEQLLQAAPPNLRLLVVTDSLFSMDGDFADLRALVELKQRYGFLLVIDEAHATLVCGDRGGGAAEMMGVANQASLLLRTLCSKFKIQSTEHGRGDEAMSPGLTCPS